MLRKKSFDLQRIEIEHRLSHSAPQELQEYLLEQLIQCLDRQDSLIEGLSAWLLKICIREEFIEYCIQLEAELIRFSKALRATENLNLDLDYCGVYQYQTNRAPAYRYLLRFDCTDLPAVTFEFRFAVSFAGVLKSVQAVWGDLIHPIVLPPVLTQLPKLKAS